ncbi:MAG: cation:dicarboxylase symporter family transporter [Phycisphaera sp.]|nr:cation:dicarboxylase symporter family transporter [Phycisphaera sp.]
MHWQILLGLGIGAALGYLAGHSAVVAIPPGTAAADAGSTAEKIVSQRWDVMVYGLVGDLFLNGLKLIIVPIVTSSIILAVASISRQHNFGRLGLKTLVYYISTSLIAILIGLAMVNLVRPGFDSTGKGILVGQDISSFAREASAVEGKVAGKGASDFLNVFRELVPPNVVAAAAEGKLLGLIVASMVTGYFLSRLKSDLRDTLTRVVEAVYELSLRITDLVLRCAPVGVLGLIAATVAVQYAKLRPEARFGQFVHGIAVFALVAFIALVLHFTLVMPLILGLVARVNPLRHYRNMAPALVTAFSTASSSATLPVTIDCVESRAGVSNATASFVLPLGATVNMDGTALYECVAAMFICQAFGVELSMAQQFFIVLTALLTSIGVAGVPSASLVAIAVILQGVQSQLVARGIEVPLVTGMALLFVFDRPLDMCRTAVNIFSDSCGAVVVARSEGETLTPPEAGAV